MLKIKIFLTLVFFKNLVCPCLKDNNLFHDAKRKHTVTVAGHMNSCINESSGLVYNKDNNSFFTVNDGGGSATVYNIDSTGNIIQSILIPGATNYDWEEITLDKNGNLYIGDFGNNFNNRKNLTIYKYNLLNKNVDIIEFKYSDQNNFPPEKKFKNFDCEAMVVMNDSLYLFSKNRGNKNMHIYQLPTTNGNFTAKLKHQLYVNTMVTGAAINENSKEIALLSYNKIYFLKIEDSEQFYVKPYYCHRFLKSGQSEGITYTNSNTLMISNEMGKIFKMKLD